MQVFQHLRMDLARCGCTPVISAVQGEANTRVLVVTLYNDGVAWEIPAEAMVEVAYQKPDGTKGFYGKLPDDSSATTFDGNVLTATLAPQALTCAGRVVVTFIFRKDGGKILAAFPFTITVTANPAADAELSEDYYNPNLGDLAAAQAAAEAAQAAAEAALATLASVTPEGIGARPSTWMPTASDVGARPNTWMPTAEEIGARPSTWMPTAEEVGASSAELADFTPYGGRKNFVTNLLHVDLNNRDADCNKAGVIATENASELLECPITTQTPFYAYREVLFIDSPFGGLPKCIVRLTQSYPFQRNIWVNIYDPNMGRWLGWEWENPPMYIGVEYRTTERFNGKVVYTQAFNAGAMVNNTYVSYPVNTEQKYIIRGHGFLSDGTNLPAVPNNPTDEYYAAVDFCAWEMWMRCNSVRAGKTVLAQIWYTKETIL